MTEIEGGVETAARAEVEPAAEMAATHAGSGAGRRRGWEVGHGGGGGGSAAAEER